MTPMMQYKRLLMLKQDLVNNYRVVLDPQVYLQMLCLIDEELNRIEAKMMAA